ncbi:MAG TPA: HAD-IIIA family hydrolase [Anaerolineales bacterium]|nr:HAD-IIIA family hydrolase [Anaerolineales bacterium]
MDKMQPDYKLAIFDIDGTLTEIKPNVKERKPRLVTPNHLGEQQAIPGVPEKLSELRQQGVKIALATNRGGVAFGYNTLDQAVELAQEAAELCGIPDVPVYVCPYHARARGKRANLEFAREDDCRKPNPGMLLQAMDEAGIIPEETIFVGDRESDRGAAENAGVRFFWAEDYFG